MEHQVTQDLVDCCKDFDFYAKVNGEPQKVVSRGVTTI